MNNGELPAIPLPREISETFPNIGLTKREYFAAMAPECPDWFEYKSRLVKPKTPQSWDTLDDIFKAEAKSWINDPCFDLPEELEWFQKAWEKYREDTYNYDKAKISEKYFAWRTYYADELLKALAKLIMENNEASTSILLNDIGKTKMPSVISDPFQKSKIRSISVTSSYLISGKLWHRGNVEFVNNNTVGRQDFEGTSFDDVVLQIKAMLDNL